MVTRKRITPPRCMGRRMGEWINGWFYLNIPEINTDVKIIRHMNGHIFRIEADGKLLKFKHVKCGPQAAANRAQRWLVDRATLTLKLAGRAA